MKVDLLDSSGHIERLGGAHGEATVREADLSELERRYNGQREQLRKHFVFAEDVQGAADRMISTGADLREKAFKALGVGGGL